MPKSSHFRKLCVLLGVLYAVELVAVVVAVIVGGGPSTPQGWEAGAWIAGILGLVFGPFIAAVVAVVVAAVFGSGSHVDTETPKKVPPLRSRRFIKVVANLIRPPVKNLSWFLRLLGTTLVVVLAVVLAAVGCISWLEGNTCVELEVSSSIEPGKVEVLEERAAAYNDLDRRPGGRCVEFNVTGTSSGRAMQALAADEWNAVQGQEDGEDTPEPQVWLPTSSLWLDVLGQSGDIDGLPTSDDDLEFIAASPLVIAMPEPMAEALGWPEEQISWRQVLELSTEPDGWGSMGHPEWGAFTFGKDKADESTSGLAATVATFYAATSTMSDLQVEDLEDGEAQDFVRGVESGVHHYADDAIAFLEELAGYDDRDKPLDYVSAVVLEEQLIHEYNQGEYSEDRESPSTPLVALYPTDGTLMLDHPYVILPGAGDAQQAAAEDFRDYLTGEESREPLASAGFRYRDDDDGPWLLTEEAVETTGGLDEVPHESLLHPPSSEVVDRILALWGDLRKPANILLVLDVSGSMEEVELVGNEEDMRLGIMQDGVHRALDNLGDRHSDRHNTGLWVFPSADAEEPYAELLAPQPYSDIEHELRVEVNDLIPEGGTPLYRTAREAHDFMAEEHGQDGAINAVVLLTDGMNEDPEDNDQDGLLEDVDAHSREQEGEPSVRIFTIAFEDDSSYSLMERISEATGARAYDATDPDDFDEVFSEVLSNF